jgi:hypothetical protein
MRKPVLMVVFALFSMVACNDHSPPPAAPTMIAVTLDSGSMTTSSSSVAASDSPQIASPAAAASDGGPDFYSCAVDSDCVAVPKATCCPNGFLEAVNKQSVDAYKGSAVCEKRRRICPQFRVMDRRVALCGNESHKCEMVQPDQVVCGGAGPNPHSCPSGSQCNSSGHCAANP